ncbi:MAG: hypothetical protein JW839_04035 [Candidatus Lokiarchaeota archaeon]|nr:hypothetical protein [Candidatus Lokiarchaeota archaeon]
MTDELRRRIIPAVIISEEVIFSKKLAAFLRANKEDITPKPAIIRPTPA